jgi:hypothetical protein
MSKVRLVVYSDSNMSISRQKCISSFVQQAKKSQIIYEGINVQEWDREMLEATEFYDMNKETLDAERGSGFWLWKPYIIYKAMLDMHDGDILLYMDAGVELINDPQYIIDVMEEDVFLFGNNWNHVDWCKADTILAVNGFNPNNLETVDDDKFYDYFATLKQVQASVIFIRVSKFSREFIKSWLCYCMLPNMINDEPSKVPNYPTFRDARHDQSILTCLQIKHGLKLHYWPASYSNGAFTYEKIEQYKGDNYPVIFNHHRQRNSEY